MIITLCGSTRFKKTYEVMNMLLTLAGHIVLSVGAYPHADNLQYAEGEKENLDQLHFEKIKMSDAILVLDVGNYIGHSTQNEIECAKCNKKKIYYLSKLFNWIS